MYKSFFYIKKIVDKDKRNPQQPESNFRFHLYIIAEHFFNTIFRS